MSRGTRGCSCGPHDPHDPRTPSPRTLHRTRARAADDKPVYRLDFELTTTEPGKAPTTTTFSLNLAEDRHGEATLGDNIALPSGTATTRQNIGMRVDATFVTRGPALLLDVETELTERAGAVDAPSHGDEGRGARHSRQEGVRRGDRSRQGAHRAQRDADAAVSCEAMNSAPRKSKELRTRISADGELELSIVEVDIPVPTGDQVLVQIEATPINPSDLALLLGPADLATARRDGDRLIAKVPPERLAMVKARLDQSLPAGSEGAGTIVDAGESARAMVGKRVALASGGTYAQLKMARALECMVLPDDVTAAQGASAYVNPLTALSMLEVLRSEGHTALVHTAAASNLGQMLVRLCAADKVPLVNIVRSADQVALLKRLGAQYVVDSTSPSFKSELTEAIAATGATLAFDAISGGSLASTILGCMEAAAARKATALQPLRHERAQAGLRVWPPRRAADRARSESLRARVGRERLVAAVVLREGRHGGDAAPAHARARRADDDVREQFRGDDRALRHARRRHGPRVQQACYGCKVSGRSQPVGAYCAP